VERHDELRSVQPTEELGGLRISRIWRFLTTTSLDSTTGYTDASVQSGQTYYYVTTAVDSSSVESGYSNEVTGVVPTPLLFKTSGRIKLYELQQPLPKRPVSMLGFSVYAGVPHECIDYPFITLNLMCPAQFLADSPDVS
jgi:hypothetical protein